MPVYEYDHDAETTCTRGKRFEFKQRIVEDAIKTCPDCGAPVHKIISATSFALKGGGWYASGYGNKMASDLKIDPKDLPKAEAKADSTAPKAEAKTETKTEAAPAKTETKAESAPAPAAAPAAKTA